MKCEYCGRWASWFGSCEGCGAPLPFTGGLGDYTVASFVVPQSEPDRPWQFLPESPLE